ncbi:hypothetical protein C0J52_05351 [Blattella germanica]|nr:hypothetical protein C0J52_05351 [Blattella germanica]
MQASLILVLGACVMRTEGLLFKTKNRPLAKEYDFIVVGGGSAGAVVASRLSEISNWTVLLLEAGGDELFVSQMPMLVAYTIPTALSWDFETEVTPGVCMGLKGGRCPWPRGKVLGGTSVLNYMVYARGNRNDYNLWEALGNPGWGYDEVLKYFMKSEDQQNPYLARGPYHGVGGPLTISESPFRTPLALAYLQAAQTLGFSIRDTNGQRHSGFQFAQGTLREGARCSTNKAFLGPETRQRSNLQISLRSTVTRLLMQGRVVAGVEVSRDGRRHRIRARREELNIPVVEDLPVGYNLHDHIALGGLTFLVNQSVSLIESEISNLRSILKWLTKGSGPLSVLGGVEAIGLASSSLNPYPDFVDWPDLELLFAPGSTNSDEGLIGLSHGLSEEVYRKVFLPIKDVPSFTIFPVGTTS